MDIRQFVCFWTGNQMASSPGHYSGRRATTSDLNIDLLNKIADGIKKDYGVSAHDSFVKMVWSMPSLAATAFLSNLYELEAANWDLSNALLSNDKNFVESQTEAEGAVLQTIFNLKFDQPDQTEYIRRNFRKAA
jgi:hypothetical protein